MLGESGSARLASLLSPSLIPSPENTAFEDQRHQVLAAV